MDDATVVAGCAVLGLGGIVAIPVAATAALIGAGVIAGQLATGDTIPAILYLPTLVAGVALLAGWR